MRKPQTLAAAITAAAFIGLVTPRASFADPDRHGDGYRAENAVKAVLGTFGHVAKGGHNGYGRDYVNDGGHGRKGREGYRKHDGHGGKHARGGDHRRHGKHARHRHHGRHGHFARHRHGHRHGPRFAGRDCHKVSKVRYDGYGGRKRIVGTRCYDRYGNGYIVPGSRYVVHRY